MRGRSHGVRGLTVRAVLFRATRDLIPLYALYGVLFADHGLNTAQISLLLALWSVTAFVLEVPSGAWADTVSRRALLILAALLLCAGFTLWTVLPGFLGFALGFVVWGVAGALESGTFEALVYDELSEAGESAAYARIMGYVRAAEESAVVVAILAAAPLYAWGGYGLVGWVSVVVTVLHIGVACSMPGVPRSVAVGEVEDLEDGAPVPFGAGSPGDPPTARTGTPAPESDMGSPGCDAESSVFARYRGMLRAGIGEALRVRRVRHGVLLGALIYGITAYDEYFALLARDAGVATAFVPLLVGVTVLGSLTGSLLAGRTEAMSGRTMGAALGVAGVLFVAGALACGFAAQRPGAGYVLATAGFLAIGVSYGVVFNTEVVAQARLQDAIEGPARATVTSVSGLLSEVVALAVFGVVALATTWLSLSSTVALLGVGLFVIALAAPAWLPERAPDESGRSARDSQV